MPMPYINTILYDPTYISQLGAKCIQRISISNDLSVETTFTVVIKDPNGNEVVRGEITISANTSGTIELEYNAPSEGIYKVELYHNTTKDDEATYEVRIRKQLVTLEKYFLGGIPNKFPKAILQILYDIEGATYRLHLRIYDGTRKTEIGLDNVIGTTRRVEKIEIPTQYSEGEYTWTIILIIDGEVKELLTDTVVIRESSITKVEIPTIKAKGYDVINLPVTIYYKATAKSVIEVYGYGESVDGSMIPYQYCESMLIVEPTTNEEKTTLTIPIKILNRKGTYTYYVRINGVEYSTTIEVTEEKALGNIWWYDASKERPLTPLFVIEPPRATVIETQKYFIDYYDIDKLHTDANRATIAIDQETSFKTRFNFPTIELNTDKYKYIIAIGGIEMPQTTIITLKGETSEGAFELEVTQKYEEINGEKYQTFVVDNIEHREDISKPWKILELRFIIEKGKVRIAVKKDEKETIIKEYDIDAKRITDIVITPITETYDLFYAYVTSEEITKYVPPIIELTTLLLMLIILLFIMILPFVIVGRR